MNVWQHIRHLGFEINLINEDFYIPHANSGQYSTASEKKRWLDKIRDVQYLLYPSSGQNNSAFSLPASFPSVESFLARNNLRRIEIYVKAFYGVQRHGARTFFHVHPLTQVMTPPCERKLPGGDVKHSDPSLHDLSYWDSDEGISFQFCLLPSANVSWLEEKRTYGQAAADFINWLYSDLPFEVWPED